jgi:metal-responsive CopG/Arc/MetJ family transcriptional regulator
MMHNTSIEIPDEIVEEIDDRRHSTVSRSQWIREAIQGRLDSENSGEWETPQIHDGMNTGATATE